MTVVIFAACKDPQIGPDDDQKPKDDAGYIQFESPAVGQQSSYAHFYANGYWEATPLPIKYTRDTIHWEITKQINRNTFEITERLSGEFFGADATIRVLRTITFVKEIDRVRLTTDRSISSPLLGYKDTLEISLGNAKEYPFTDWRIGENNSIDPYSGYVSKYFVKDKEYDRLDVYSDFTPTAYDGMGLIFAYNSNYGVVRHYGMNPWVGDVSGFDLIRNNPNPNSLVGSEWRLRSIVYDNGSVKSIEELFWGDKDILKDPNFTLIIKSETEVHGFSGCNSFGGEYSLSNDTIRISNLYSTEVYCTFSNEYQSIISESTTYSSNGESLTINSNYGEVKSLIYERITNIVEEFPLENTNWILENVHYTNGDIVPIEKVLGSNGSNIAFNQFVLEFKEDNLLGGFSGCNTFGGEYKVEKSKIDIIMGNTKFVACKFTDEYSKILSNSTKFMADRGKLVIYSTYNEFKALEFSRKFR